MYVVADLQPTCAKLNVKCAFPALHLNGVF